LNTVLWFAFGLAAGAGAVAAAWWVHLSLAGRRRLRAAHDPPSDSVPLSPTTFAREVIQPIARAAAAEPEGPPPSPDPARAVQVRLSERIVLELARLGRMDPDAPARAERTQTGLVAALGTTQSAVSKVLRRLEAAEIVTSERRHVQGVGHRMKAYALTRRGELLAREIARRRGVSLLPAGSVYIRPTLEGAGE